MRHDEFSNPPCPTTAADPRWPVRSHASAWAGRLALSALVAVTSWAVAIFASPWLVPPYLALMAWVLGVPNSRRKPTRADRALATTVPMVEARVDLADSLPFTSEPEPELVTGDDAEPFPSVEPSAVKTRRGKTRGRKAKAAETPTPDSAAEPAAPSWIRLGPGKFVRADPADPSFPSIDPNPDPAIDPVADPGVAVEAAPDASEEAESWDNGIAPDALDEAPPDVSTTLDVLRPRGSDSPVGKRRRKLALAGVAGSLRAVRTHGSTRVLGVRRSSCRLRSAGRPHRADRTHPPRSPPTAPRWPVRR